MTAKEKIDEAEYFLNRLPTVPIDVLEFEVSAFLCAGRSIFDHVLDDYANKFRLGEIEPLNAGAFEARSKTLGNKEAIEFIGWYRNEKERLAHDKTYGFLFSLRNVNIHRRTPKQILRIEGRTTEPLPSIGTVEIPIVFPPLGKIAQVSGIVKKGSEVVGTIGAETHVRASFKDNPSGDLLDICVAFLKAAKEFVAYAQDTWPITA